MSVYHLLSTSVWRTLDEMMFKGFPNVNLLKMMIDNLRVFFRKSVQVLVTNTELIKCKLHLGFLWLKVFHHSNNHFHVLLL